MTPIQLFKNAESKRKPIGWFSIIISIATTSCLLVLFALQHNHVEENDENISRLEDSIRDILFLSNRAFIIYHEEGGVVNWPPAAVDLLGWTLADVRKNSLTIMIPEKYQIDHTKAFEKALHAPLKDRKTMVLFQDALCKDGTLTPVKITVWVVGDESRSIVAVVESVTKVVEHKG